VVGINYELIIVNGAKILDFNKNCVIFLASIRNFLCNLIRSLRMEEEIFFYMLCFHGVVSGAGRNVWFVCK
jgi:hypothetical protein